MNTAVAFLFSFLLFADTPVTTDAPLTTEAPRVTHFQAPDGIPT